MPLHTSVGMSMSMSMHMGVYKVCPDHNQPNRAILVDINFDELDLLDSAQVL